MSTGFNTSSCPESKPSSQHQAYTNTIRYQQPRYDFRKPDPLQNHVQYSNQQHLTIASSVKSSLPIQQVSQSQSLSSFYWGHEWPISLRQAKFRGHHLTSQKLDPLMIPLRSRYSRGADDVNAGHGSSTLACSTSPSSGWCARP